MTKISECFLHDCLKANAKKFHLFLSSFVDKAIKFYHKIELFRGSFGSYY